METKHKLEFMFQRNLTILSVRLSKFKGLTMENTLAIFEKYPLYLISEEMVSDQARYHQHIVVGIDNSNEQEAIKTINGEIKKQYPDCKGNKHLYVKLARNPKQLIKYTLKEGCFKYKGFSEEFIKDSVELSKSKEHMKDEFITLEEKLMLKQIRFQEFMEQYVNLKVLHGQPLYDNHIIAYGKRMAIQCGELKCNLYAESVCNRIFYLG